MRIHLLVPALLSATIFTVAVAAKRADPAVVGPAPAALGADVPAPPAAPRAPRKVAIVVYDGVEILDLAGPAEVLQVAGGLAGVDGASALELYLVARTAAPVTAQGFITITPHHAIADAPPPDLVIIPGGSSGRLTGDPEMMRWLTDVTGAAETTLTVCTGAFALAETGALDGLEATTWYGAVDRLAEAAPRVAVRAGRRFVDSGRFVTTAGVSAGIDGALHLVARLFGRRVADQTARYMEYAWSPEPYLAGDYPYWNPSGGARGRLTQEAALAYEEERWPEAARLYRQLAADDPSGTASYNLGCVLARSGDRDGALAAVERALAAGVSADAARRDPDLASIRDLLPGGGRPR